MDQHARDTLAELGLRLADALHALTEELRECRKAHTALRQQVERLQEAVSDVAGRPPARPARAKPRGGVADTLQRAL